MSSDWGALAETARPSASNDLTRVGLRLGVGLGADPNPLRWAGMEHFHLQTHQICGAVVKGPLGCV